MSRSIVGVVGYPGQGKDEVAHFLEERNFAPYSLQSPLHRIAERMGEPINDHTMAHLGSALRAELGKSALAQIAKTWIKSHPGPRIVIRDIRLPEEAYFLRENAGVTIVGVTASDERQFELYKTRKHLGDEFTFEEFRARRQAKIDSDQGETMGLAARCLEMANIVLENNGHPGDLLRDLAIDLKSFDILLEGYPSTRERR